MALAGTGSPMKESVCRVSRLNFASLNAEVTGMSSDDEIQIISQIDKADILSIFTLIPKSEDSCITIITIPGARPNEIISANESSSLPMGE